MLVAYSMPSHYINQWWVVVNWTLRNKRQWDFNQSTKLFIKQSAYQNIVCEMAALLSRPQCVKCVTTNHIHDGHATITSYRPEDAYMHKELALIGLENSLSLVHHKAITWSKYWINVNWAHRNELTFEEKNISGRENEFAKWRTLFSGVNLLKFARQESGSSLELHGTLPPLFTDIVHNSPRGLALWGPFY